MPWAVHVSIRLRAIVRAQRSRNFGQKGKMIMQVTNERPDQTGLTIDQSAALLGLHEFSLLSRIQAGEIKSTRLRSGEMAVPESELERLARSRVSTLALPSHVQETDLPDDREIVPKRFSVLWP